MAVLSCGTCGESQAAPKHCGQDMRIERVDGVEMLVCHMGPGCGKQSIPEHHGAPMSIAG